MYDIVLVSLFAYGHALVGAALAVDGSIANGTELVFAFLIHREADRTPISPSDTAYSNDPVALQKASEYFGYGELTDAGKRRAFYLGQYIRERYGKLLSKKYKNSEIFVRSTDVNRNKMTVLVAMTALYPHAEPPPNRYLHWDPVPYTVVPVKYDFNQATRNCPKLRSKLYSSFVLRPKPLNAYHEVLRKLSYLLGYKEPIFENMPVLGYFVNDLYSSQISLGIPMTAALKSVRTQMAEIAALALQTIFGDKEFFPLQSGPLLKEFMDYSIRIIGAEKTPRVRIYSTSDMSLYALFPTLGLKPNHGAPRFAALLSLELRRNLKTGKYLVLAVYLPSPKEKPSYLTIQGCDDILCSYTVFYNIAAKYAIDVDTWRRRCGWKSNIVFDDSTYT